MSLSGQDYVIPPIRVADTPRLQHHLDRVLNAKALDGTPLSVIDQLEDVIEIVLAALQRNYPAMTREQLVEIFDAPSLAPALQAAVGATAIESRPLPALPVPPHGAIQC